MFEVFCKFGILTAFIESPCGPSDTKSYGKGPPSVYVGGEKG